MSGLRMFWAALGGFATALALAGLALPLLPTTPFVLLAGAAFSRASPRLDAWLVRHPQLGPLLENWRRHGGIDRRTKRRALVVIACTPALSWLAGAPAWVLGVQLPVLAGVIVFILTRPEPPARPCSF